MNANYDLIKDLPLYTTITAIQLISIVFSLLLVLGLGCIRFILRRDRAFLNDYDIVFYLLFFMAWTYFVDSLIFLLHTYVAFPCPIFIFFKIWLSNQATMLASAFAVLLVRRFKFSFVYWLIPLSISLILALITFAFDRSVSLFCWYDHDFQVVTFALYVIPQGLCILFNFAAILYVLITKPSSLPASYTLYSLIPLVSQLGHTVVQVSNNNNSDLLEWSLISNGLGGLIVFLVFFSDPLFWHSTSLLSRAIFKNNDTDDDDEETTLGEKRHTALTNQSDHKSTKSNSMISLITPPAPVMKKSELQNTTSQRPCYQPSLSLRDRTTPLIIFPPPPPTAALDQRHPTSLELEESDFIDMFAKPSLHIETNATKTDPPCVIISPTICYEMEDAVPWRVLEADEEECIDAEEETHGVLPRSSSITSNYRKESWLSLSDDDLVKDDDRLHLSSSFSSSLTLSSAASSPAAVSDWLTRRSDSLDGMREHMGRTSKSIRRWCRNVHEPEDLTSRLHVVHEEQPQ